MLKTDTPQQEKIKLDTDASAAQLLHPDPMEFSIVTSHAVESPYVTITDKSLSQDEKEHVWKMLGQYENKRDRLLNIMNIAWTGLWMGFLILSFPALFISVVVFGMDALIPIAWFTACSLIPGSYFLHKKRLGVKAAQKVNGTVVGYSEHIDSDSGRMYALRVEYRDQVGMKHIITSSTSSGSPFRKIGDQVNVLLYADGSDPELLLFADLYMLYCIWLFAGVIAILFLLGLYFLDRFYPLT
jgi:hypothetical protein